MSVYSIMLLRYGFMVILFGLIKIGDYADILK